MTRRALMVVAKQPSAGQTKTRLCPPLSGEQAAALYECLLQDTLDLIRAAQQLIAFQAILVYSPSDAETYFRHLAPDFDLLAQQGDNLSERLNHATTEALTTLAYQHVVIIDSDSPMLPASNIKQAFSILDRDTDISLGPCDDGGYYLIGMKKPAPSLFLTVTMSTAHVTQDTIARADDAGLALEKLPTSYDIDYVADLKRLALELKKLPSDVARYTRAFLSKNNGFLTL